MEFAISYDENLDNAESLAVLSGINLYLDVPKALLKVLKHFISAIRSLINSPSSRTAGRKRGICDCQP